MNRTHLSIVAGALLCTSHASHAEVISNSAYGFTIENRITIPQPANNVWHSLVSDVDKWWPKDHTWWGEKSKLSIEAKAGGCFCEHAQAMGNSAEHMRVTHVDKHKLLRMTGGLGPLQGMGIHGALDWQLEAIDKTQTRVTLRYQANGYMPEQFEQFVPIVDKVQAIQLQGLGKYLQPK